MLGLVIWVAVGRATQSLTHVNRQVASRSADNLTPLDVANAPSEIGALVTSLNQLFARVQGLIEQKRRFTANAAHELRTPLAGIRAQAQVALGATGDAERAHALDGGPATRVAIQIEPGNDQALVRISDAGPGISASERAHVGRRFYRAPGTQAPGSGLGLSIVHRILELHRGRLQFDAPPTGSGLQVTVALPRVRDARV